MDPSSFPPSVIERRAPDPSDFFIRIACAHCNSAMTVHTACAGQPVKCDDCEEFVIIPKQPLAPSMMFGDIIVRRLYEQHSSGGSFLGWERRNERLCNVTLAVLELLDFPNETFERLRQCCTVENEHLEKIHQVGVDGHFLYLSGEFIRGETLQGVIDTGQAVSELVSTVFILDTARGLAAACNCGFFHGSLSPAKITQNESGGVKVMGWAQSALPQVESGGIYTSPEMEEHRFSNQRSDLYSLGAIWCALLDPALAKKKEVGKACYTQSDLVQLRRVRPELSTKTFDILSRLLEADTAKRCQSYEELIKLLESLPTRSPSVDPVKLAPSRSFLLPMVGVLTGLAIGATAFLFFSTTKESPSAVQHLNSTDIVAAQTVSHPQSWISGLLPDPGGFDSGREKVEISSVKNLSLEGWKVRDVEDVVPLTGTIHAGESLIISLNSNVELNLNNSGNAIELINAEGVVEHTAVYTKSQVLEDAWVYFAKPESKRRVP